MMTIPLSDIFSYVGYSEEGRIEKGVYSLLRVENKVW